MVADLLSFISSPYDEYENVDDDPFANGLSKFMANFIHLKETNFSIFKLNSGSVERKKP